MNDNWSSALTWFILICILFTGYAKQPNQELEKAKSLINSIISLT